MTFNMSFETLNLAEIERHIAITMAGRIAELAPIRDGRGRSRRSGRARCGATLIRCARRTRRWESER